MSEFDCRHCLAPDTNCPHWQGTFCELNVEIENQLAKESELNEN